MVPETFSRARIAVVIDLPALNRTLIVVQSSLISSPDSLSSCPRIGDTEAQQVTTVDHADWGAFGPYDFWPKESADAACFSKTTRRLNVPELR